MNYLSKQYGQGKKIDYKRKKKKEKFNKRNHKKKSISKIKTKNNNRRVLDIFRFF